jgi:hypothetical protein
MGTCSSVNWDALTNGDVQQRYLLRNKAQGLALKKLCVELECSVPCVDKVYAAFRDCDVRFLGRCSFVFASHTSKFS